eukprot:snap_masked-scaffold_13-processed-gene-6.21-mRNA-1 protein AED:1.00 eAED:1.00 QI:0/0/0/0/1/1/2/0/62
MLVSRLKLLSIKVIANNWKNYSCIHSEKEFSFSKKLITIHVYFNIPISKPNLAYQYMPHWKY